MNPSIYSKLPPGDVLFSHGVRTLWSVRFGYLSAAMIVLACIGFSVWFCSEREYWLSIRGLTYVVVAVVVMVSNRNTVYKINLTGERVIIQTAFGENELRVSELKDVYKIGDAKGGFTWIIKSVDKDYKFQAKKEEALVAIKALLNRIPSPPSSTWREFKMSSIVERTTLFSLIALTVVPIFFISIKSIGMAAGAVALLVIVIFALQGFVRSITLNNSGIVLKNFMNQEKTISWQSMEALRHTKEGLLTLKSNSGKFRLNTVDGSNIVVDKILENVNASFYIDDLSAGKKLKRLMF